MKTNNLDMTTKKVANIAAETGEPMKQITKALMNHKYNDTKFILLTGSPLHWKPLERFMEKNIFDFDIKSNGYENWIVHIF